MNKIDAIRVSTAWTDSETLKNELKVELNSIEYQAILTNIDNYDTTLSYLSGIIWKYYKSYYLTTSTKERCVELLANELSGKLNYYYALINQYKEAYNKNYETIRSSENTNDRNITTSRTGFNKQATTPETIDAGAEYIDNYSTSQQKYNSSGTELGKNTFKSNISGSSKELWENINAIPKRIYEGIIGLVSKYFFYVYDDDLVPCVELTLEQAIKELNDKLNILEPKVETNSVNIQAIGGVVDDLQRQEKAMRETLENLVNVTPTDIDYNEGFTLMHDGTPITGQVKKVKLGNNLTYDEVNKTINATGGEGGGGGVGVIELTNINGTIPSTQLGEINANPQNFTFKYNGKILLFTKADSTNYQYCNNTTNSTDNSVMTKTTLLTIEPSTGAYTIAENVHNVVANSIHPTNGGDLTNIQVGSKVYSIPSGGGGSKKYLHTLSFMANFDISGRKTIYGTMVVLNDSPNKIPSISSASEFQQSSLFNSTIISFYGLYYGEYTGTNRIKKIVINFYFVKNSPNFFEGVCIDNIENGNITIGDPITGKSFLVSKDTITEL